MKVNRNKIIIIAIAYLLGFASPILLFFGSAYYFNSQSIDVQSMDDVFSPTVRLNKDKVFVLLKSAAPLFENDLANEFFYQIVVSTKGEKIHVLNLDEVFSPDSGCTFYSSSDYNVFYIIENNSKNWMEWNTSSGKREFHREKFIKNGEVRFVMQEH